MNQGYLPPIPRPRTGRWWKWGLAAAAALLAWAALRTSQPAGSTAPDPASPATTWAGVWARQGASGPELPFVELGADAQGRLGGRMIVAGPADGKDVSLPLAEAKHAADDAVEWVISDGHRLKYQLVRTGPDRATLFAVEDGDHTLKTYLAERSPAAREKLLRQLQAPQEPQRLGTMARLAARPAATPGPPERRKP